MVFLLLAKLVEEILGDVDHGMAEVVMLACVLVVICEVQLRELVEAIGTKFRGGMHGV